MKASMFVGTSVDGFIARHNGDFDFLPEGGGEPHGYTEFIATVDVLVIGRNTFEKVLTFNTWPYEDMRVVVLSGAFRVADQLISREDNLDGKGYRWYQAWTRVKPWEVNAETGYKIGAAGIGAALVHAARR